MFSFEKNVLKIISLQIMAREKENDFFLKDRKAWLSVLAACEGVSEPI